jgi:hypothetical protein
VADVGLHRTQHTEAVPLGAIGPEGLRQGRHLDGVPHGGSGSVGLQEADGLGLHPRHRQRLGHGGGLSVHAGGQEAHLPGPVVVHGGTPDQGVDVIPGLQRLGGPLQDHHPRAAPEHGAQGVGIEGAAVPVIGEDLPLLVQVADVMRLLDGHPPGQRHVALPVQEALGGQVDPHQRRRAGGLHVHAGARQVKKVRHPGGEEVLVVPGVAEEEESHIPGKIRVRHEILPQVGVGPRGGEDPYGAPDSLRGIPGVFQGLPRKLQEVALLGIHDGGVPGAEAEEAGVEHLHVLECRRHLHVVRVPDQRRIHSGGLQLRIRQRGEGLHPLPEIAPEPLQIPGSGKTPGHPHHCNGGLQPFDPLAHSVSVASVHGFVAFGGRCIRSRLRCASSRPRFARCPRCYG